MSEGESPAESGSRVGRPTICLTMIVRNERHVIREALDSAAPYISSWVIVDTGSDDGTQELVTRHMAALAIPGVLHERPWVDFGHNRTEALALAQGHGDYIWVLDADDVVVGDLNFGAIDADVYRMRHGRRDVYWLPALFRNGLEVRYRGVTHEYAELDDRWAVENLVQDYKIQDRHTSHRNISGQKLSQDCELLLTEVGRNPGDSRSVFYLARSYFDLGDFDQARRWFSRRIEMGGWAEEVYYSMLQCAQAMERSNVPWPDVQDAYLRAWEFRPTRVEALAAMTRRFRRSGEYDRGYLFAEFASQIPLPEGDVLFVDEAAHLWGLRDERAICAAWLGHHHEALALCRELIAQRDVPESERERIATNRDFSVPAVLEAALMYPAERVRQLVDSPAGDVVVSLVAGADRSIVEQTLNSFLNCCRDLTRVARFLVLPAGLSASDRAVVFGRYPFLDFIDDARGGSAADNRAQIRGHVDGRFWLHLDQGWTFIAPENYLTRLTGVFDADPTVLQVGVNYGDAEVLTGGCAPEDTVRRSPIVGRYVVGDFIVAGPAMFDVERIGEHGDVAGDPIPTLARCVANNGARTATLDEVLCVSRR